MFIVKKQNMEKYKGKVIHLESHHPVTATVVLRNVLRQRMCLPETALPLPTAA